VDTVVLGCTHYPFAWAALQRALGPDVRLVDTAPAIARRTAHLLEERRLSAPDGSGSLRVLTTGDAAEVAPVVARLCEGEVPVESLAV
jgi:glutamate racemase